MNQKFTVALATVVFVAACSDAPGSSSPLAPAGPVAVVGGADVVPGRFIITLRDGASPATVARENGVTPDFVYTHVLNGFAGSMSDAARSGLLRDARVSRVEADGIAHTTTTQSNATWGIDRVDQRALPLSGTYTYTNAYSHAYTNTNADTNADTYTYAGLRSVHFIGVYQ